MCKTLHDLSKMVIAFFFNSKKTTFKFRINWKSMKSTILVCFITLAFLWPQSSFAQNKPKKPKTKSRYGNTDTNQWWIGVRGGVNFSNANPQKSYAVLSYTQNTTDGDNEKKYNAFTLPGLQFGFSVSYEFLTGLSVNLIPLYSSYRFSYDNSFRWYHSDNQDKRVETSYNIETRLQYIELPLTFKYELTRGSFKPYIQAGGYYSFLADAIKKVSSTEIDQASGSDSEINVTTLSVGINDRTKKANYGIIGGAGFTYNIGNARFGLEVNYLHGLQNLDNGAMKYVDNQLVTGAYDVPDDYTLNSLEISMQVIIPLKFITSKDYIPL